MPLPEAVPYFPPSSKSNNQARSVQHQRIQVERANMHIGGICPIQLPYANAVDETGHIVKRQIVNVVNSFFIFIYPLFTRCTGSFEAL